MSHETSTCSRIAGAAREFEASDRLSALLLNRRYRNTDLSGKLGYDAAVLRYCFRLFLQKKNVNQRSPRGFALRTMREILRSAGVQSTLYNFWCGGGSLNTPGSSAETCRGATRRCHVYQQVSGIPRPGYHARTNFKGGEGLWHTTTSNFKEVRSFCYIV